MSSNGVVLIKGQVFMYLCSKLRECNPIEVTHLVDLGSQYTITKPNPLRANDCFQRRARAQLTASDIWQHTMKSRNFTHS